MFNEQQYRALHHRCTIYQSNFPIWSSYKDSDNLILQHNIKTNKTRAFLARILLYFDRILLTSIIFFGNNRKHGENS